MALLSVFIRLIGVIHVLFCLRSPYQLQPTATQIGRFWLLFVYILTFSRSIP